MQPITFSLPWPPSVNTYWRSIGRGRVILSAKGRRFRAISGEALATQAVPRDRRAERLSVALLAQPPDKRVRDLDNLLKPLLDCLTEHGVIEDDSQIDSLQIVRGQQVKDGAVWVRLSEHIGGANGSSVSEAGDGVHVGRGSKRADGEVRNG